MTDATYFDDLYAHADDPWGLATEAYEARKYALTLAALPRARYRRGFEPGCAIGVLTSALAARCEALVSWDGAAAAVQHATERVRAGHVRIEQRRVPGEWPDGSFDLVVVSELLYFLDADERIRLYERVRASLEPGGHLVAVHWRHAFDAASGTGDEAHAELATTPGWGRLVEHIEADFLLGVWERQGG